MIRFSGVLLILALFVAGCGGGGGSSTPAAPQLQTVQGSATILIPAKLPLTFRRSQFVSPSVNSGKLSVSGLSDQVFDLSATSKNCTSASDGRTCTVPISAPSGQPSLTMNLYDAANASGNLLGTATTTTSVAPGQAFTVGFTVNGVVASVVVNVSGNFVAGQSSTGSVSVTAKDMDGNAITGPGNYSTPITVTNSDTSGAFTMPSGATIGFAGSSVALAYNGKTVTGNVTIGATATNVTTTNVTPAVINTSGTGTPTPSPSTSPSSSPTATPTASSSVNPFDPTAGCSQAAAGAGTYTQIIASGNVSGSTFTASTSSSSSIWVKSSYAAGSSPTPAPSATATATASGAPTQAAFVYFGTYMLLSGTAGCATLITSADGTPLSFTSGFNAYSIDFPAVQSNLMPTFVATGHIASEIVNFTGNTGTGTVSLDNGDSGTINLSGKQSIALPAPTATPTPGPVVLTPNTLNFTAPSQFKSTTATQTGNAANSFSSSAVTCPSGGSGLLTSSNGGVFTYESLTPGSCFATITGAGGITANVTLNF